ncbi:hypothetical protein BDV11DRAFT_150288 [Aspergillus similis]
MLLGVNASCIVLAPTKHASQGSLQTSKTGHPKSADESFLDEHEPRWLACLVNQSRLLSAAYSTRDFALAYFLGLTLKYPGLGASVPPRRCRTADHTIKLSQQLAELFTTSNINMGGTFAPFPALSLMRNAENTNQRAPATSAEVGEVASAETL